MDIGVCQARTIKACAEYQLRNEKRGLRRLNGCSPIFVLILLILAFMWSCPVWRRLLPNWIVTSPTTGRVTIQRNHVVEEGDSSRCLLPGSRIDTYPYMSRELFVSSCFLIHALFRRTPLLGMAISGNPHVLCAKQNSNERVLQSSGLILAICPSLDLPGPSFL